MAPPCPDTQKPSGPSYLVAMGRGSRNLGGWHGAALGTHRRTFAGDAPALAGDRCGLQPRTASGSPPAPRIGSAAHQRRGTGGGPALAVRRSPPGGSPFSPDTASCSGALRSLAAHRCPEFQLPALLRRWQESCPDVEQLQRVLPSLRARPRRQPTASRCSGACRSKLEEEPDRSMPATRRFYSRQRR